ncbi:MAG TPA: TMEM175 family protein [Gaiellaceae bacterium]
MEDVGTARLETFSDGVFAIAATLLVLELGVDEPLHHSLGHELLHLWPSYLAYATSFLTIGIMWVNHHACFERIGRADRTLLFLNVLFLMLVSFVPFPTRLVAEFLQEGGPNERAAAVAYGCTLTLTAILFNSLWLYATTGRRLVGANVPQERVDEITRTFAPGVFLYGGGTGLAFVSPVASIVVYLVVALLYVPSASIFLRSR